MAWVQFVSDRDSTTVHKGFKASFKAGVLQQSGVLGLSFVTRHVSSFISFSFGK